MKKKGEELIEKDNFQKVNIQATCDTALNSIQVLTKGIDLRKERLRENWSRLQFYWRCEVVEMWIQQKEELLMVLLTTNIPSNLTYIRQLIARHTTFLSSLDAFESEGIRPIVELRFPYFLLYLNLV